MCKVAFSCCVFLLNLMNGYSLGIFHEKTKVTFQSKDGANYFGYTVLLSDFGFFVGAPKAKSRVRTEISPGSVFECPTHDMDARNVSCTPFGFDVGGSTVKADSEYWYGAVVTAIPTKKLLICAPRWTFREKAMNGACYMDSQGKNRGQWLVPLLVKDKQGFEANGKRKEYGKRGNKIHFYENSMMGMSAKVTEANTIIFGDPGLLKSTGGVTEYQMIQKSNSSMEFHSPFTPNPYNDIIDVGPDDYLGYSVESGVFDVSGKTLYVAGAPRSAKMYGQVLIFALSQSQPRVTIKAKVFGPHLGSYFGATVACADVDGDGVVDLLVGAPSYVDNKLHYDQGAVFVYLTEIRRKSFVLNQAGLVTGSKTSGARFGSAIADLGDVDGDGYTDIAIGAPFENEGRGAVYVYKGSNTGLRSSYAQRITAESAQSFGISISKGLDVDGNNCNDLAVGAYESGTAYIFRCIPTMKVRPFIQVPEAMKRSTTLFNASFCIESPMKNWVLAKIDFRAKIAVEAKGHGVKLRGNTEYPISITPGYVLCQERSVEIVATYDPSKPISLKITLEATNLMAEEASSFIENAARLSEDSNLQSTFNVYLTRSLLKVSLVPWINPYVPGMDKKLGFSIKILNMESAYGAKIFLELPLNPVRIPSVCTLEGLMIACVVPINEVEDIKWDIEMELTLKDTVEKELNVIARSGDYNKEKNETVIGVLNIAVTPKAEFEVSAQALPPMIVVKRELFNELGSVDLIHTYKVTNLGPSDWYHLQAIVGLPEQGNLIIPVDGCSSNYDSLDCTWPLRANESISIVLLLRFDIAYQGDKLSEENGLNLTSKVTLLLGEKSQTIKVTTKLVLESTWPLWPLIVGLILGSALLAALVYGLYKCGFFSRINRDKLKRLKEQECTEAPNHSSTDTLSSDLNQSVEEIIS